MMIRKELCREEERIAMTFFELFVVGVPISRLQYIATMESPYSRMIMIHKP
jgi:hypothetical protein